MKRLALTCLLLVASAETAHAVDHTNIDATRPLDFDDADAIAYREKALEFGAALDKPRRDSAGLGGSVEYLYGFAANSHLSLDFNPSYAQSEPDNGSGRRFDVGNLGVGVFHNFNREHGDTPALAARLDAYLPTGRGAGGVDVRLRGIATRQFRSYDKLHLNLDVRLNNGDEGERRFQLGAILGYSHPLGFPTSFDKTLLAQVGLRANEDKSASSVLNVGLGVRQQVSPRNVLDYGLTSDLTGGSRRQTLRLVAGYSTQF